MKLAGHVPWVLFSSGLQVIYQWWSLYTLIPWVPVGVMLVALPGRVTNPRWGGAQGLLPHLDKWPWKGAESNMQRVLKAGKTESRAKALDTNRPQHTRGREDSWSNAVTHRMHLEQLVPKKCRPWQWVHGENNRQQKRRPMKETTLQKLWRPSGFALRVLWGSGANNTGNAIRNSLGRNQQLGSCKKNPPE